MSCFDFTYHRYAYGRSLGYALNGIRQTTLAYDPAIGRLASMLVAGNANPFAWSYLPSADLKSQLAYPNGLTAAWTYDANNRLTQARNATASTISQYDYTYDTAGRRVSRAKSGAAMSESRSGIYGYNARSELVSSARTGGAPSPVTEHEYAYDPIGNRTSSSDLGTTRAYTANSLNQYTEISTLRVSAPLRETFIPQFDDDGNQTLIQTKTGVWSVTYNGENRPIQWSCVASNSSTPNSSTPSLILMSFDLMGRRVSYTETVGVVTNAHRTFVYDNYLQIANSEHTTSNSQLFVWDPTEPVATRPLVWHHNGGTCFYTHDGNKNVSELVDGNGAVVAHYEYAPFGDVTAAVGNLAYANRFRFSSEYADDTLGLVYYNYRHYEPVLGRWIRRDPIGMFWVENVYGVCNYIQYYDHLGLTKISWDDFKKVEKNSNLEFVSIIALEWSYTANELGTEVTPLTGDDCLNAKKVRDNGRPYVDVECPCAECYEVQSFYKDAIVTVSINHEKSYVKKFALDDLGILAHEQLHVTISEKMALKASEELRKVKGAKVKFCNLESGVDFAKKNPPSESSLDNKFKELYLQEQNMQNQYDNETEHGSIPQKQKEWEDKWK